MFDPITITIITGLTIPTVSGIIIAWVRRRWKKRDCLKIKTKEKEELEAQKAKTEEIWREEIQKSIWRINKTIIILTKILDDFTMKHHPDLTSNLEDIVSEILRENDKKS